MRFRCHILLICFVIALVSDGYAQEVSISETPKPSIKAEIPTKPVLYGIGFSRYSNFDPDRSFAEAKQKALTDLAANSLTSVYLEYYGTNDLPTQLQDEYAISDSIHSFEELTADSAHIGPWAVYYLTNTKVDNIFDEDLFDILKLLNWQDEVFEPQNFNGRWITTGRFKANQFDPDRAWTKARQEALKNLSLYLSTVVKANQRAYNEQLSTINYTTSKLIFKYIGVLKRAQIGDFYYVVLTVHEDDIVNLEH